MESKKNIYKKYKREREKEEAEEAEQKTKTKKTNKQKTKRRTRTRKRTRKKERKNKKNTTASIYLSMTIFRSGRASFFLVDLNVADVADGGVVVVKVITAAIVLIAIYRCIFSN